MNAADTLIIDQNTNGLFESQPGHYVVEASDLRLPPGYPWPDEIETTLGNKRPFIPYGCSRGQVTYCQAFGTIKLTLIND